MPSKSQERRLASQREAAEERAPLRRFYFPSIGNGVTILASSQEEANEKAAALSAKPEVPAEDSSNE